MNEKIIMERICQMNENSISISSPPYDVFYYHSILYSAECSVRAFKIYEDLLNENNTDAPLLISLVQEAIGHAGMLSSYFWNDGGKKPKEIKKIIKCRSDGLKTEFGLEDSSAIKNKLIRNTFEHFDERLDMFLLKNLSGNFYPIPKFGTHSDMNDQDLNKNFKLLDVKEKCLVLLNQKFFFENIQKEVIEVYNIAQDKIKKYNT